MTEDALKHLLTSTALLLAAATAAYNAQAEIIPLLNHNFESDSIDPAKGATDGVSGWVSSGFGGTGVYIPEGNNTDFVSTGNKGQVAFLDVGGRMRQKTKAVLEEGTSYTLSFDVGQKLAADAQFAAHIKADGLILARLHSADMNLVSGRWTTESLTFTASKYHNIGSPIYVEFNNLSKNAEQVNIDNIHFSSATADTDQPWLEIGSAAMITQDATLLVPDQFPNINVALRYLDDKQIKVSKTVTIQVTDCDHQVYTESVEVAHPNGDAIHIIGDVESPESCALQFENVHGFVAQNGNRIGLIDGFTISGNITQGTAVGVLADNNAYIRLGGNIIVESFSDGIAAHWNSSIDARYIESRNNSQHGYISAKSSTIKASNSTAEHNGIGYIARDGSYLHAYNTTSRNNHDGYQCFTGSFIYALSSKSLNNSRDGFNAWNGARIYAQEATASGNGRYGFHAYDVSSINVDRSSASSNNRENYAPARNQIDSDTSYIN